MLVARTTLFLLLPVCSPSARADPGTVIVAVHAPLTGPYKSPASDMIAGVEAAADDLIKKRSGPFQHRLAVRLADDACDNQQAVAIAEKAAASNVALVIGHFCSGAAIAAARIYAAAGILMITPAATHPTLTVERAGPTIFRLAGRDDRQGEIAGTFLATRYAGKRVAILYDRTQQSRNLAEEMRRHMNRGGHKEVLFEAITLGEKSYSAVVARLLPLAPDVVYLASYPTEAAMIVRQMRAQGMTAVLMAGDTVASPDFWRLAEGAGEGTLVTWPPHLRRTPAKERILGARSHRSPDPQSSERHMFLAYAAVEAWIAAVTAVGSSDPGRVAEALATRQHDTVVGRFRFDAHGDATLPSYTVHRWTGASLVEIEQDLPDSWQTETGRGGTGGNR